MSNHAHVHLWVSRGGGGGGGGKASKCDVVYDPKHLQCFTFDSCSLFSDDSIKVFVRVRPFVGDADGSSDLDRQECLQVDSLNSVTMLSKPDPKVFTFDRVAGPQTTQVSILPPAWLQIGNEADVSCVSYLWQLGCFY